MFLRIRGRVPAKELMRLIGVNLKIATNFFAAEPVVRYRGDRFCLPFPFCLDFE